MKRYNRLLSLLLAFCMVFTLAACTKDPEAETGTPTTVPAATEPSEPGAADIYNEARKALDAATDLTSEVTTVNVTTINDTVYTDRSVATVTYRDIGKETAAIFAEKTMYFGDSEEASVVYTELWSQGQLYAGLDDKYRVVAPLEADELTREFVPPVLMDAGLYESITMEETGDGTLITFSQATAPEAWVATEEMQTSDIIGTALIQNGTITEMTYGITVDYGVSRIRGKMTLKPAATVKEITVPTDTEGYTPVDDTTALYVYGTISKRLPLTDKIEMSTTDMTYVTAGGLYMVRSNNYAAHGKDKDGLFRQELDIYAMDYYYEEEYDVSYIMDYKDGKLTTTPDEGLPSSASATWEEATESMWGDFDDIIDCLSPDNWENVTTTAFGNLILYEFDLNENFGNTRQNSICETLYEDPNFLLGYASKYENAESTGYLSVDGCTGLPVAAGFSYEGTHTIDGENWPLLQEVSLSVVSPSVNAYKAITDELPVSQEPEEKATPLFYKVTGSNGQQMWLLGTIHVGDARNEHLPQEIKNAFRDSDALAIECDTRAYYEQLEKDEKLAAEYSAHIMNEDGKSLEDILEKEDYETLVKLLKASGQYSPNVLYMKPSVVASFLSNVFMDLGYTFTSDYGIEEQLYIWADVLNKPIREVESVTFQMEMDSHYSKELQILLLQQALEDCPGATWMSIDKMYDLWCSGDEIAVREYLNQEPDLSGLTEEELAEYEAAKPLMEEYDKAMIVDRNRGMLEVAIEYLESGDVIFYAVGLAHLLEGDNGLVDTLRQAGYTVEQVTYAN